MAFLGYYTICVTIEDAKQQKSRVIWHMPRLTWDSFVSSFNIEPANDVEYYAHVQAELIDKIIDGKVIDVAITTHVTAASFPGLVEDLKAAPLANSDVEEGGRFSWQYQNQQTRKMWIPSVSEVWFNDQGHLEYVFADDMWRFIGNFELPEDTEIGADWSIKAETTRNDAIMILIHAHQLHKKSRKLKR